MVGLGKLAQRGLIHLLTRWGYQAQAPIPDTLVREGHGWVKASWATPEVFALPWRTPAGGELLWMLSVPHPQARGGPQPVDGAPALKRSQQSQSAAVLADLTPSAAAQKRAPRRPKRRLTIQRAPTPQGKPASSLSSLDLWNTLFDNAKPLPTSELLALSPKANQRTQAILEGITTHRLVGIANALFNPCRRQPKSKDQKARTEEAWDILLRKMDQPYSRRGTHWEALILALGSMPPWARERIEKMDITEIGSVAQRVVRAYDQVRDRA